VNSAHKLRKLGGPEHLDLGTGRENKYRKLVPPRVARDAEDTGKRASLRCSSVPENSENITLCQELTAKSSIRLHLFSNTSATFFPPI